jgi:hypothetical protein
MTWSSTVAKVQHCILGSHSKILFQTISFFENKICRLQTSDRMSIVIHELKALNRRLFSALSTAAFNGAYFSGSPIDLLQYYKNILQKYITKSHIQRFSRGRCVFCGFLNTSIFLAFLGSRRWEDIFEWVGWLERSNERTNYEKMQRDFAIQLGIQTEWTMYLVCIALKKIIRITTNESLCI